MNLEELQKLGVRDRARYYRNQAVAALRAAESASDSSIKVAHLLMANNWERLADHCMGLDRYRRRGAALFARPSLETSEVPAGSPKAE